MNNLPLEILIHIITFVNTAKDYHSVCLTSKSLCDAAFALRNKKAYEFTKTNEHRYYLHEIASVVNEQILPNGIRHGTTVIENWMGDYCLTSTKKYCFGKLVQ